MLFADPHNSFSCRNEEVKLVSFRSRGRSVERVLSVGVISSELNICVEPLIKFISPGVGIFNNFFALLGCSSLGSSKLNFFLCWPSMFALFGKSCVMLSRVIKYFLSRKILYFDFVDYALFGRA